jgi:hypothetical protein
MFIATLVTNYTTPIMSTVYYGPVERHASIEFFSTVVVVEEDCKRFSVLVFVASHPSARVARKRHLTVNVLLRLVMLLSQYLTNHVVVQRYSPNLHRH